MTISELRKQISRTLFNLVLFIGVLTMTFRASAQIPPVGKYLYKKLATTLQQYQQVLATGDSLQVAEVCYLLGKRYSALGDYVTAQAWFIRSLRIREPLGPSESIGKIYLRMAENQSMHKQYAPAMSYARQAIANFQQVHSTHGLMSAYIVLAGVHETGLRMNREKSGSAPLASLDSALFYFRKAEQLALSLKKPLDIANVYTCMGRTLTLASVNRALPYLKKAYSINSEQKIPYGIINSAQQLADCYLLLKQPLIAKKWLDKAMYVRDTAQHGDYWQNGLLEETYTNLYQQTGQWKQAFEHQQKYYGLRIQDLDADRQGAIAQASMRYESQKKEVKLKAQQKELALRQQALKTQQQLTALIMALFGITGVACLVLYWLFRKYWRLSEHNAKLVKEQNHRVKNNLQSITNLLGLQFNRLTDAAARQAVEESLLRVEAMALVHQRLYDGDRLVEVELRQYIPELVGGVLRSFSVGHIQPDYSLGPIWLDADRAIHLGLLLNELVTNSCKYAFPLHAHPQMELGCQLDNGTLQVWYSDNGPGFTPSSMTNTFGMKLIDMVTQKLKGKSQFRMASGCSFRLSFNVQTLTPH